jgi:hypothetical protein
MRILATVQPPKLSVLANIQTVVKTRWAITPWIEGRTEVWSLNGDDTPMTAAYNHLGDYVGDLKFAKYLAGQCIRPQKRDESHSVCSIGYSAPEHAWYGWSHRAMVAFMIGDRIFEEAYGDDNTLFTQHGSKEITTMAEAKEAACRFAEYVS